MRARVLDSWERLTGVSAPPALDSALTAALRLRAALDDHHPWFLHPARTALILLDDCAEVDPVVLATAVGVDSLVPDWHTVPAGPLQIPVPARAGERLLEALVAAPRRVRLVACAERLDHARHLHMVEYADAAGFRAQVAEVYLPVAERTDALLARRMRRWLEAAGRRRS
ncbi:MAG TPA: hypothetical protein VK939_01575 [Longimicrobiales bacterium]|nr:hypothetical protein [Longimicrobiales bacterium]